MISLTLVLGVFFVMEGVASIMYGLEHRRELTGRWGWMIAAGILDLVISGMIITGLPGSAEWAIGLLVGINLVFGGATPDRHGRRGPQHLKLRPAPPTSC